MRQLRDAWRVLRGTHITIELGHAVRINGELGMERFRLAHLPPDGRYAATLPEDIVLPSREERLGRRALRRHRRDTVAPVHSRPRAWYLPAGELEE